MEKVEDVRREIDATREQMAATAAEIETRIHDKVDAVKQKLDLADHVRAHPWPALAVALVAGAALAASGSDRKAVAATTKVAKRAPRATLKAVKATGTGAAHLAGSAVHRMRGGDKHESDRDKDNDGIVGRLRARFAEQARELGAHLGRAADDLVKSAGAPRYAARDSEVPLNPHQGDSGIGITTPYPPTSAD